MKKILWLLLLAPSLGWPCDWTAGPGKAFRGTDGDVGGFFTAACVWREKYELRGWYVAQMRIYDEQLTEPSFFAVSGSRLWMFREGKRFRPMLGMGVLLKPEQRCHFNGDTDCNRMLPLSYAFLLTGGVRLWGTAQLVYSHASNNGMDWGPEKKNLGMDSLRLEVIF